MSVRHVFLLISLKPRVVLSFLTATASDRVTHYRQLRKASLSPSLFCSLFFSLIFFLIYTTATNVQMHEATKGHTG